MLICEWRPENLLPAATRCILISSDQSVMFSCYQASRPAYLSHFAAAHGKFHDSHADTCTPDKFS